MFRGFPWWKVPIFWFSQLMGAFVGSGLVFANYMHAIHIYDPGKTVPGTASLFSTYAVSTLRFVRMKNIKSFLLPLDWLLAQLYVD